MKTEIDTDTHTETDTHIEIDTYIHVEIREGLGRKKDR